jgi:hypothetical protein
MVTVSFGFTALQEGQKIKEKGCCAEGQKLFSIIWDHCHSNRAVMNGVIAFVNVLSSN